MCASTTPSRPSPVSRPTSSRSAPSYTTGTSTVGGDGRAAGPVAPVGLALARIHSITADSLAWAGSKRTRTVRAAGTRSVTARRVPGPSGAPPRRRRRRPGDPARRGRPRHRKRGSSSGERRDLDAGTRQGVANRACDHDRARGVAVHAHRPDVRSHQRTVDRGDLAGRRQLHRALRDDERVVQRPRRARADRPAGRRAGTRDRRTPPRSWPARRPRRARGTLTQVARAARAHRRTRPLRRRGPRPAARGTPRRGRAHRAV